MRDELAALARGGLVHWVELHVSPGTAPVWAIYCGGYATQVVFECAEYPTCLMCASGMDYWREGLDA